MSAPLSELVKKPNVSLSHPLRRQLAGENRNKFVAKMFIKALGHKVGGDIVIMISRLPVIGVNAIVNNVRHRHGSCFPLLLRALYILAASRTEACCPLMPLSALSLASVAAALSALRSRHTPGFCVGGAFARGRFLSDCFARSCARS